MKWIYCILLVGLLNSCGGQDGKEYKEIECENFVLLPEVENLIRTKFLIDDSSHFDSQLRCFFLSYVRERHKDTVVARSFRVVNNILISNESCPYTMFNYSILRDNKTLEYFYYGQSDVFELSFSGKLERGEILKFRNDGLNDLINKLCTKNTSNDSIREYIMNLYYSKFEDFKFSDRPVFDRTRSLRYIFLNFNRKIIESILQQENGSVLQLEFIDRSESDFLILESDHLGMVIFKIDRSNDGRILIKEFLLPSVKRIMHFRSGSSPPDCN